MKPPFLIVRGIWLQAILLRHILDILDEILQQIYSHWTSSTSKHNITCYVSLSSTRSVGSTISAKSDTSMAFYMMTCRVDGKQCGSASASWWAWADGSFCHSFSLCVAVEFLICDEKCVTPEDKPENEGLWFPRPPWEAQCSLLCYWLTSPTARSPHKLWAIALPLLL